MTSQLAFQPTIEDGSVLGDELDLEDPLPPSSPRLRRQHSSLQAGYRLEHVVAAQLATHGPGLEGPRQGAGAAGRGTPGAGGGSLVGGGSRSSSLGGGLGGLGAGALPDTPLSSIDVASSHADEEPTSPRTQPSEAPGSSSRRGTLEYQASMLEGLIDSTIEEEGLVPDPDAPQPHGSLQHPQQQQQEEAEEGGTPASAGQPPPQPAERQQQLQLLPRVAWAAGRHRRHSSMASSWREASEYMDTPATPSTGLTFSFQPSPAPRPGPSAGGQQGLAMPGYPMFGPGQGGGGQGGEGAGGAAEPPLRSRPSIVIPPPPSEPHMHPHTGIKMSVARR